MLMTLHCTDFESEVNLPLKRPLANHDLLQNWTTRWPLRTCFRLARPSLTWWWIAVEVRRPCSRPWRGSTRADGCASSVWPVLVPPWRELLMLTWRELDESYSTRRSQLAGMQLTIWANLALAGNCMPWLFSVSVRCKGACRIWFSCENFIIYYIIQSDLFFRKLFLYTRYYIQYL